MSTPGKVTVVNRHHKVVGYKRYVGRGTPLGNLFHQHSREVNIQLFKEWLDDKIARNDPAVCNELNLIANAVLDGKDVLVECSCAPRACHADYIKELVDKAVHAHLTTST